MIVVIAGGGSTWARDKIIINNIMLEDSTGAGDCESKLSIFSLSLLSQDWSRDTFLFKQYQARSPSLPFAQILQRSRMYFNITLIILRFDYSGYKKDYAITKPKCIVFVATTSGIRETKGYTV